MRPSIKKTVAAILALVMALAVAGCRASRFLSARKEPAWAP